MTDTGITDAGNVTPLPVEAKRRDTTAALRQRRSRAKRKPRSAIPLAPITRVTQPGKRSGIKADVTVAHSSSHPGQREIVTAPKRTNYCRGRYRLRALRWASDSTFGTPRRAVR
jgi:hypothetical protein